MTTITFRQATLGPTINDRTEKHGNEDKPALDLSVSGIVLTVEEFNALAGHPGAYHGVFDLSSNPPRFAYPGFSPVLALAETIKGCDVMLRLGLELFELKLSGCNVKGGIVELASGVAAMSCKIQHEGELTGEQLLKLRAAKNKSVDIELVLGAADKADDSQGDLPLNSFGTGEQPDTAKPKRRGNGQPAAH